MPTRWCWRRRPCGPPALASAGARTAPSGPSCPTPRSPSSPWSSATRAREGLRPARAARGAADDQGLHPLSAKWAWVAEAALGRWGRAWPSSGPVSAGWVKRSCCRCPTRLWCSARSPKRRILPGWDPGHLITGACHPLGRRPAAVSRRPPGAGGGAAGRLARAAGDRGVRGRAGRGRHRGLHRQRDAAADKISTAWQVLRPTMARTTE